RRPSLSACGHFAVIMVAVCQHSSDGEKVSKDWSHGRGVDRRPRTSRRFPATRRSRHHSKSRQHDHPQYLRGHLVGLDRWSNHRQPFQQVWGFKSTGSAGHHRDGYSWKLSVRREFLMIKYFAAVTAALSVPVLGVVPTAHADAYCEL